MEPRKKTRSPRDASSRGDVITLDDLAPHHDVRGGAGRRVFGADAVHPARKPEEDTMAGSKSTKKTKDLEPKKNPKGGRIRL
jgi:hypothetical protein